MSNRMKDKIAIVTGAGSGIGKGIAMMFAEEGAKVIAVDFNEESGMETTNAIIEAGGESIFVKVNVRVKEDIDHLYDVVMEKYGTITTLVNCAGILFHGTFEEHDDEVYERIGETNCRGYVWMMQKFLPVLSETNSHGKNSVLNVASISCCKPESGAYFYGGFKAFIDVVTRNLAREYGPKGVRMNVLCPGPTKTPFAPSDDPEVEAFIAENVTAIKRLGYPVDLAYAATYLCSDEATWVTGHRMVVDGGACMMGN